MIAGIYVCMYVANTYYYGERGGGRGGNNAGGGKEGRAGADESWRESGRGNRGQVGRQADRQTSPGARTGERGSNIIQDGRREQREWAGGWGGDGGEGTGVNGGGGRRENGGRETDRT